MINYSSMQSEINKGRDAALALGHRLSSEAREGRAAFAKALGVPLDPEFKKGRDAALALGHRLSGEMQKGYEAFAMAFGKHAAPETVERAPR